MISGFCAALAAAIDPAAAVFFVGLVLVIVALRWRKRLRFGGVVLYAIGAVPPIVLHAVLTVPVTGDLLPPSMHAELRYQDYRTLPEIPPSAPNVASTSDDDDDVAPTGWVHDAALRAARVLSALAGARGHGGAAGAARGGAHVPRG